MAHWLVTWEWVGDHAKVDEPIAAILDGRLSAKRVRELVEVLHANARHSLSERLGYAKRRFNPYPATFGSLGGVPWEGQVSCGANPFLFARLVDNLQVTRDAEGREQLAWDERPRPIIRLPIREG